MLHCTAIGDNEIARASAFRELVMQSFGHAPLEDLEDADCPLQKAEDEGLGSHLGADFDGRPAQVTRVATTVLAARDVRHWREIARLGLKHGDPAWEQ
jgi:hypothetical protein